MVYRFDGREFCEAGNDCPAVNIPFVDDELVITIKNERKSIVVKQLNMNAEFYKRQCELWQSAGAICIKARNYDLLCGFVIGMILTLGGIRKGVWITFEPPLSAGVRTSQGIVYKDYLYECFISDRRVIGVPVFSEAGEFIGVIADGELVKAEASTVTHRKVFTLEAIVRELGCTDTNF